MKLQITPTQVAIVAVLAFLLMFPAFAGTATANTTSDYGGDDFCGDAVDPSGAAAPPPTTLLNTSWCDGNSPDTAVTSVGPAANGIQCVDNPNGFGAAADTLCEGGGLSAADTAYGAGEFGGDYPVATHVEFMNTGPAGRFAFSADYRDVTTGVYGSTALSPIACVVTSGTFEVDVTGSDDAAASNLLVPAGTTIDHVYAFRVYVTTGGTSCGNGDVATRVLTFTWDYETPGTATSATAALAPGAPCPWSASATNTGTAFGEAQISLYDIHGPIYDNGHRGGVFLDSGAASGADASGSAGGLIPGDTYELVATVWAIGETYAVADTLPIVC